MTITNIAIIIASLALLFSICTVIFSILAYSTVVGLKNSTHNIQYMPAEEFAKNFKGEEIEEEIVDKKSGMPIVDPVKKEEIRQKKLLESFAEMYKDSNE